ncbi:class I SAM-dependent methyltransferase [Limnofasciculus baicalensis]|uniref:Class I SAM-dependent methyltransferase n=1 Tax=Limnofasciculus baicalensis BBK-W-15 TaxID=2699891 RepID=A0AAE3GXZ0_9CYAN|nr:methyltransferase domain-containing protein [Limnofasciculus baicalensis]MCP2730687.1 class I SAM-dependent methyltransferase [Limnofasciculus baicalensis BBK-W-15]
MEQMLIYLDKIFRRIPWLKYYEIKARYSSFDAEQFYLKTSQVEFLDRYNITKINYACGKNYLTGWLNVDCYDERHYKKERKECIYYRVNLITKHPFPDNCFEFGFAEDFLEHIQQDDSIIFLAECYRTLKPDGLLRLSFPGLEGVLKKHYNEINYKTFLKAKQEAFTIWDHLHFYSRDELKLVAEHIGYREVNFVEHGVSKFPELNSLDTRKDQIGLNTYVELRK